MKYRRYSDEPPINCWQAFKRYFCCIKPLKRQLKWKRPVDPIVEEPPMIDAEEQERQAKLLRKKKLLENVVRIQKYIRGFLGRRKAKTVRKYAFEMNDKFWSELLKSRQDDSNKKKVAKMVRKMFVYQYVADIVDTAALFIIQQASSTKIQKVWRGYWYRSRHPRKRRIPPPRKRPIKLRYGPDVYRRVWARTSFVPKGGWPGRIDCLEYDIWEHADHPPKGPDYGLRVKKLKFDDTLPENYKNMMFDKNAWVGLPIFLDSSARERSFRVAAQGRLERLIRTQSPYLAPVVHFPAVPTMMENIFENKGDISDPQLWKALGWDPLADKRRQDEKDMNDIQTQQMWNILKSRSLFTTHFQDQVVFDATMASSDRSSLSAILPQPAPAYLTSSRSMMFPQASGNPPLSPYIGSPTKNLTLPSFGAKTYSKIADQPDSYRKDLDLTGPGPSHDDGRLTFSSQSSQSQENIEFPLEMEQKFVSFRQETPLRGSFKPVSGLHSESATLQTHRKTLEKDLRPSLPSSTWSSLEHTFSQGQLEDANLISHTSYRPRNPVMQFGPVDRTEGEMTQEGENLEVMNRRTKSSPNLHTHASNHLSHPSRASIKSGKVPAGKIPSTPLSPTTTTSIVDLSNLGQKNVTRTYVASSEKLSPIPQYSSASSSSSSPSSWSPSRPKSTLASPPAPFSPAAAVSSSTGPNPPKSMSMFDPFHPQPSVSSPNRTQNKKMKKKKSSSASSTVPSNTSTTSSSQGTSWQSSAWGQSKQGALRVLEVDGEGHLNRFQDDGGDSHPYVQVGLSSDAPEDFDLWSRALYRPRPIVLSKAKIWPTPARTSYHFRYSWLPQAYVRSAAQHFYSHTLQPNIDSIGTLAPERHSRHRSSASASYSSSSSSSSSSSWSMASPSFLSSVGHDASWSTYKPIHDKPDNKAASPYHPLTTIQSGENSSITSNQAFFLTQSQDSSMDYHHSSRYPQRHDGRIQSNNKSLSKDQQEEELDNASFHTINTNYELLDQESMSHGMRAIDRVGLRDSSIDTEAKEALEARENLDNLSMIIKQEVNRRRYGRNIEQEHSNDMELSGIENEDSYASIPTHSSWDFSTENRPVRSKIMKRNPPIHPYPWY